MLSAHKRALGSTIVRETHMATIRIAVLKAGDVLACSRCASTTGNWDRIGGKSYCPECQEAMVCGLTAPLRERAQRKPCAACRRLGTLPYLTFPLQSSSPVEFHLCREHLTRLVARQLDRAAFRQLRQGLGRLGLDVDRIFLLHDAFYDRDGRPLQPADSTD